MTPVWVVAERKETRLQYIRIRDSQLVSLDDSTLIL